MNCNRIVAFSTAALATLACGWAQHCAPATQNGPVLTDTVFRAGQASGEGECNTDQTVCSPITATINVTRVVGQVNDDGTLVNPNALIQNGVVAANAYLNVGAGGFFAANFAISVTFNGQPIGGPHVVSTVYGLLDGGQVPGQGGGGGGCYEVPIQYVHFATRNPGGAPTPGVNTVVVTITAVPELSSPFTYPSPIGPCDDCSLSYGAGTLSIQAMAPVVLVHGWNAGPWVWGPTPANSDICPVNPKNLNDGGQNFVQALIDTGVPFDCTVTIDPQISSIQGGLALGNKLTTILNGFGTRHVNLVAHSKGGLFARGFLQYNALSDPTTQIGVVSLTTLDTPHHGSVLADTIVAFNNSLFTGFVGAALQAFQSFSFLRLGANDLTVAGVRAFNDAFLQPPPQFTLLDSNGNQSVTTPCYYSTSANADLDGNGSISTAEAKPYTQLFGNLSYNIIARGKPVNVVQAAGLLHADTSSIPNGPILNDLLVSIPSAQYIKFTEISSFVGANGRNHQTIRCGQQATEQAPWCASTSDIAPLVLHQISIAESSQPAGCSPPAQ